MVNLKELVYIIELRKKLERIERELKQELLDNPSETINKTIKFDINDKTKEKWSSEQKAIIKEYMNAMGESPLVTNYQEIRIKHVPTNVIQEVQENIITSYRLSTNYILQRLAKKLN